MNGQLLNSKAMMLWIFLLQLINSVEGLSRAEYEPLCTSNACFTLHMDKVNFTKAHQNCEDNGGYLMTIRDRGEEDVLRSLLSQLQGQHQDKQVNFWIGLKLNKGSCVLGDRTLRGFTWVTREEESHYSNWAKEPVSTCTERCVRVNYNPFGENQLKWMDGKCKINAFYACKFYSKGMCSPLALVGPGKITYTPPFSKQPLKNEMKSFPLGTYANILCSDRQPHYSVCMWTDLWTEPGPFCKTGERNCTNNNGGCEDECHEDGGGVRCVCRDGYDLDEDGLSCTIKDSCGADSCEHQCVMGETGYSCECREGFQLQKNQHNCSDIDECQTQACEDHVCVNTRGSYTCTCKDGYEMVHGECSDVDECAQSPCEHSCFNSIGSFSCQCSEGFTLSQDGHSCSDVDECVSERCQFTCVNTDGSFSCSCPPGFNLESDAWTCSPDMPEASEEASSPHTHSPRPHLVNVTHESGHEGNASLAPSFVKTMEGKVLLCVLGSVVPLLALVAVTLAVGIFRCSRSKKEAKKNQTADGYCWVSSGLDPRLEKLYESILTDDL
ncbi:complement component C1q receptor [Solea solea]|uniref:complement component C1q receptor n=1 Tax=Solea solea TaxID=90069 RepID=UPI002729F894|nr:complement component C1q receptor [Solea solea]